MNNQPDESNLVSHQIGVFKLKDKVGRNGIRFNLSDEQKHEFDHLIISKVQDENNKIVLTVFARRTKSNIILPKPNIVIPGGKKI